MKKIFIFCLLIFQLPSIYSYAQHIYSVATNNSFDSRNFALDSTAIHLFQFAKRSPFYLKQLVPKQYSAITLGYRYNQGKLIQAQDAGRVQDAYLATEGSTMLKSVNLWGMFSYHKLVEDSTLYNHQTRNNMSSPYYFGSPINVSYERSIYNLKAMAEKELLPHNLPIGLGADYRIGSHFSTNDPRGSISDFQFNLIGTVGYKFFDKLKIGGGYRYGYGQERFTVAYKNNAFSQNTLLPAYNNYLISGYGEAFVKNTERSYNDNQTRRGFDGYLTYGSKLFGAFNFNFSLINEKQKYVRSTDAGIFNYNDYTLDQSTFNLLWFKEFSNKKIVVDFNYDNIDGADYNYTYLANNYVYNSNKVSLTNTFTIKKNKHTYNYKLVARKVGEERKDGLTGNSIAYEHIDLLAGFGYNVQTRKAHYIGFNLNGIYSLPISDTFSVTESNIGLFTKTVIFHDYNYQTSAKIGGAANIEYSLPTFNDMQTGIKAGITYVKRTDDKGLTIGQTVGNHRLYSNISLNFYF